MKQNLEKGNENLQSSYEWENCFANKCDNSHTSLSKFCKV